MYLLVFLLRAGVLEDERVDLLSTFAAVRLCQALNMCSPVNNPGGGE